ncbi:MAG: cysteine synthase family protein [Candidatus Riflebacteria bacterium]|nr:cysteine synthase family protein [Candidatus Riflebacteria bacterium]
MSGQPFRRLGLPLRSILGLPWKRPRGRRSWTRSATRRWSGSGGSPQACRRPCWPSGATLVEATAGNTGLGLALVAAARGYRLACVMPEKMSMDKRVALASLGASLVITPNVPPDDERNFRNVARRLARERGWFHTDQFANPANPRIHESTTGPEILTQVDGPIGAFVAGAGTGGTLTGVGRFLRSHSPGVRIVLADPIGSRLAHLVSTRHPDVDSPYQVEGIGGSVLPEVLDLTILDEAERVSDEESIETTMRLWREEGLFVGPSSGTAVAAALRVASRPELAGPVVVVLADSWDRYFSKPWLSWHPDPGAGRGGGTRHPRRERNGPSDTVVRNSEVRVPEPPF